MRGELDNTIAKSRRVASAALSVPVVFRPRAATGDAGFVSLVVPSRGRPVLFLVALRDAQLVAGRAGQANNAPVYPMPGGHGARQRGGGRGVASNGGLTIAAFL